MNSYKSLDALISEIGLERKRHPIKYFFIDYKNAFLRIIGKPRDWFIDFCWFIQRGRRGYADCDVWNLDGYLSKIIVDAVLQLKKSHHGLPVWEKGMTDVEAEKKWVSILNDIIFTFSAELKMLDSEWTNLPKKIQTNKMLTQAEILDLHIMTTEETEQYRRGWFYFKKYFKNLWD